MSLEKFVETALQSTMAIKLDDVTPVRILKRPEDPDIPFVRVYRHFLQSYINTVGFPKAPLCLQTPDCPGCLFAKELAKTDPKMADRVKARVRDVYWAIDRRDTQPRVKMLEVPPTVTRKLANLCQRWQNYDFTDPDEGCDVIITRVPQGQGYTYEVAFDEEIEGSTARIKSTPLTPEERALEVPNLLETLRSQMPDPEEFRKALQGAEEPTFTSPFSKAALSGTSPLVGEGESTPEPSQVPSLGSDEGKPTPELSQVSSPSPPSGDGFQSSGVEAPQGSVPDCFGNFSLGREQCHNCAYAEACLSEKVAKAKLDEGSGDAK